MSEGQESLAVMAEPPRIQLELTTSTVFESADLSQYFPWIEKSSPVAQSQEAGPLLTRQSPDRSDEVQHTPRALSPGQSSGPAAALARASLEPGKNAADIAADTSPDSTSSSYEVTDQDHSTSLLLRSQRPDRIDDRTLAENVVTQLLTQPDAGQIQLEAIRNSKTVPYRDSATVIEILEDKKLPGYQLWQKGSCAGPTMQIRVPKQLVGWKAILTKSSDLHKKDGMFSLRHKPQTWEVRQESLKNCYEFRYDSEIQATMHGSYRLFKHEWSIIVKDGTQYVWKMSKNELSLYHDLDDRKIAEYHKAVPWSSDTTDMALFEAGTKIGSISYFDPRDDVQASHRPCIQFDLVIASFFAILSARGGASHITAGFEASNHPLREVLHSKQEQAQDREEMMQTLPRSGFARDAQETESVLSDTTDEDGPPPPAVLPAPQPYKSPVSNRRRFTFLGRSPLFASHAAAQTDLSKGETQLTASQRIVNHYRSKSNPMH